MARIRPARMRRIVDLPQPDGPSSATTSFGADGEVDVLEHAQRLCRSAVGSRATRSAQLAEGRGRVLRSRRCSWSAHFVKREAVLGEAVASAPDGAVEGHDDDRHDEATAQPRAGRSACSAATLICAPRPGALRTVPRNVTYSATMLAFHAPPAAVTQPVTR